MGFYSNITNSSKTNFTFDKIYSTRYEMDTNAADDGVFIGRYVLVSYGQKNNFTLNYTLQEAYLGEDTSKLYYDSIEGKEIDGSKYTTDYVFYVRNKATEDTLYIFENGVWKDISTNSEGVTLDNLITKASSSTTTETDCYSINYKVDQIHGAKISGHFYNRGFDGTVWQKVYDGTNQYYIKIAELNGTVPSIDLVVDKLTTDSLAYPMAPYLEVNSNILYTLHMQEPWKFKGGDVKIDGITDTDIGSVKYEINSDGEIVSTFTFPKKLYEFLSKVGETDIHWYKAFKEYDTKGNLVSQWDDKALLGTTPETLTGVINAAQNALGMIIQPYYFGEDEVDEGSYIYLEYINDGTYRLQNSASSVILVTSDGASPVNIDKFQNENIIYYNLDTKKYYRYVKDYKWENGTWALVEMPGFAADETTIYGLLLKLYNLTDISHNALTSSGSNSSNPETNATSHPFQYIYNEMQLAKDKCLAAASSSATVAFEGSGNVISYGDIEEVTVDGEEVQKTQPTFHSAYLGNLKLGVNLNDSDNLKALGLTSDSTLLETLNAVASSSGIEDKLKIFEYIYYTDEKITSNSFSGVNIKGDSATFYYK